VYSVLDILGLLAGALAFAVVFLLPGIALAHIANVFDIRRLQTARIYVLGLIIGYAVLPVVDSLLCRSLGLGAALICNLALAGYGLRIAWLKGLPRPDRFALIACGIWLALLTAAWVDVDTGQGLYPSLLMLDIVKHAATVRALVETGGAPPLDPFFMREDPAGYYYFYYVLSALAERLCAGWIDSRAAVGSQVFWTGIATVGLVALVFEKAGFRGRPRLPLMLALMLAAGLQILPILGMGMLGQLWMGQINWWSDQVTSWPLSLLWVPHHVACLVACWAGFLLLAEVVERRAARRQPHDAVAVVLAGLAFASAAGLSIWVTCGAVAAIGLWIGALAIERRWSDVLAIGAAGLVGLVVAAPYLADLVHHRAYGSSPIALTVRVFPFTDMFFADGMARYVARFAVLPINYVLELGVFLVGSYLFWWHRQSMIEKPTEVARLLALSAIAGLVLATFVKSTIVNNDLGWRAILFTQLAALLWTVAVLCRDPVPATFRLRLQQASPMLVLTLVLGYAGVVYDLVALRAFHPLGLRGEPGMLRNSQIDRELRGAYAWLTANTDRHLVVQHNPDAERALGYGLYGRARVGVSDRHNARLFGAPGADVAQRLAQVIPVFAIPMPAAEARRRLTRNRVDTVVVTASDPVWRDQTSWVWTVPALYATAHVRVLSVRETTNATAAYGR